jgi:hypothetical protein
VLSDHPRNEACLRSEIRQGDARACPGLVRRLPADRPELLAERLEPTISVSMLEVASLVSAGKGSETGATGRDERVQLSLPWEALQFMKSTIREFEARPVD